MEPQQEVFGTGLPVIIQCTQRLGVLAHVVGTDIALETWFVVVGAIETEADGVGTVVEAGEPVLAPAFGCAPGFGTVVVASGKDVVESEWHHVIDQGLTTAEEQLGHGTDEVWVVGAVVGAEEVGGDGGGGGLPVVGEASEGVPVGHSEVVGSPVGAIADVRDAGYANEIG